MLVNGYQYFYDLKLYLPNLSNLLFIKVSGFMVH